jgi:putative ECF transporter S component (TIGR02185 family)
MIVMLRRLLEFSGNQKKNLILSFVFSFLDSIFALIPVMAVLTVLTGVLSALEGGQMPLSTVWISFGVMVLSITGRIVFGNASSIKRTMGNWYLLPYFMVVGLICEGILWKQGSYMNPKRLTVTWTLTSLLYNGLNLLPVWFFWDTYYSFAISTGMEQSYIDSYVKYFTAPGWVAFILIFTMVCGLVGSLIGQRLIKKHFKKAGVL